MLYGDLCQAKRSVGRQKKRFKDCLKVSLKNLDINLSSWESLALNRSNWRSKLTTGARAAETRHTAEAERKRAARKVRATSTSTAVRYPHVSHLWAGLQGPDWPHQSPPDPQSQIIHLRTKSWSSSTPKDGHPGFM
ncbi:hypothetical protein ACOMHN_016751 [Nucella lapillus]